MRKIYCLLCALLVAFAALQIGAAAASTEGVFVSVNYSPASGEYRAEPSDGSYTITTDDGVTVTVDADNGLTLVVYPVPTTDEEAYAWFEDCAENLGSDRRYFDIYFINNEGKRVDGGNATVEIILSEEYSDAQAAKINGDGSMAALEDAVADNIAIFEISGGGFYAVAEKISEDISEAPLPDDSDSSTDTPTTGDSYPIVWALAILLCTVTATATFKKKS